MKPANFSGYKDFTQESKQGGAMLILIFSGKNGVYLVPYRFYSSWFLLRSFRLEAEKLKTYIRDSLQIKET